MAGISREHLSRIETGKVNLTNDMKQKLADTLEKFNPDAPLFLLFDYVRIRFPTLDIQHIIPRTISHGLRSTTASRPSPSTAAKSSTPLLFPARSTRSASTSARPSTSTCSTWSSAVRHGSTSCPLSIRKS